MKNKICAFSPATIANLNVGFDILGLSLNTIGDKVEVSGNGTRQNRITQIVNGKNLPTDPLKNSCSVVIRKMQESLNVFDGVDIRIKKGFASGSGLGSSSASSAAAAMAFNTFVDEPFTLEELIPFAAEGERIACGTAHFDNVAPAILGGLVLVHGQKLVKLPLPQGLHAALFFPHITINTAGSRSILRQSTPLKTASRQIANMGAFVASLYQNDLTLMAGSLEDLIVEPSRKMLIPCFDEMRIAAINNKALAFGISGSGPSMFALAAKAEDADEIITAMHKVYRNCGIEAQHFIVRLTNESESKITNFDD
jgi:homoserine kinase